MGAVSSKGRRRSQSPAENDVQGGSSKAGGSSNRAEFAAELRSYESACKLDPELQIFDNTLQQRTSRAISTVAGALEFRSFSFNSLMEITGCLLDTNQDVARIILECKRDVWKDADLFSLVEEYFENSLKTLDFCTSLERCLKRARDRQVIIQIALQRFEEEMVVDEEGKIGKYEGTLGELRNFQAAGDPFGEEFFEALKLVRDHQLLMLKKLRLRKQKLDRKLRSVQTWRKISSLIFASAFAAVIVCSVVAAVMAAPPVAAVFAALVSVPVGSMGKWFDSVWKKYQDAVKGQKDLINTMEAGTFIAINDLENIRLLVDQLEIEMGSLLQAADFALRDEGAVHIGVGEIKRKIGNFMKGVEELGEQVARCTRDVGKARTLVLHSIMKCPE